MVQAGECAVGEAGETRALKIRSDYIEALTRAVAGLERRKAAGRQGDHER